MCMCACVCVCVNVELQQSTMSGLCMQVQSKTHDHDGVVNRALRQRVAKFRISNFDFNDVTRNTRVGFAVIVERRPLEQAFRHLIELIPAL